ncbi:zinc ribbon domain-containing protein [Oceanobacillus manasiensis]|uniref:zinc ribbon domain-containing protein n=1 Tax=Oceanobacillus manasiensis TaxID=586413 RepID=UPI0005A8CBAB|nr:zinc ribbon domain-containing protein [Oceanobacillus manasiensis]
MLYCPYCGSSIKNNEHYCITCGEKLPLDLNERFISSKKFNKLWLLPLSVFFGIIFFSGVFYLILENKTNEAEALFANGEELVLEGKYSEAEKAFKTALDYKPHFTQAEVSLNFMNEAIKAESSLEEAEKLLNENNFQEALSLINDSESNLNTFNGPGVNRLISKIGETRNNIKLEQIKTVLNKDSNIDELKILLWDAEAIDNTEAKEITTSIRDQIVDFTYTKANEQLNGKQFNDAQIIVEDGLKYAPDSEKLQSLKTTIDKEQVAFESAQEERIEQAMTTAEEERQLNETNAIELVNVDLSKDDQGKLVVQGEVKSIATIPVNSVLINYTLKTKEGNEILTNEVFVFPDKLYPGEKGKFEYTHFDIDEKGKNLDIEVQKITWYTD